MAVIAGAVTLGSWAVASASRAGATVDRTDKLVRTGAFAVSRNPMYLAWSLGLLGLAVLMRSVWLLIGAAAASMEVHREVLREEHALERAFGGEYRAYREVDAPLHLSGAGRAADQDGPHSPTP